MSFVFVELSIRIVYVSNAFEVWEDCRERFDKVNSMRLYQLNRKINHCHKELI